MKAWPEVGSKGEGVFIRATHCLFSSSELKALNLIPCPAMLPIYCLKLNFHINTSFNKYRLLAYINLPIFVITHTKFLLISTIHPGVANNLSNYQEYEPVMLIPVIILALQNAPITLISRNTSAMQVLEE